MKNKKLTRSAVILFTCLLTLMSGGRPGAAHDDHEHGHGGGPNGQPGGQPLVRMGRTPCVGGLAGTFPCRNVELASFLPLSDIGGGTTNDIWGWTDPLTGREYALIGRSSGTSFVDISDPEHPVYLGNLPTHTVDSIWRGIKVYANHAFIISEAAGHGMQVFDLTRLRGVASPPVTFAETTHYGGFSNTHTLAINEETGFAYAAGTNTCGRGLHMVDIRNPVAPSFAGCVGEDGYTHETQCVVYRGADAAYQGREICFSSNEDTLTVVDVTDKSAPRQLSRNVYAGSGYTHQGWLTEDHRHFLLDDELDEVRQGGNTRTFIWDVDDLDAPSVKGVYTGPTTAIDHNLYIRGRYAYESNYRSGLRILDISDVGAANLNEVAFFDVFPVDDNPDFNGTWGNYPFFASGIVIVSGIEQGLFVLRPTIPASTPELVWQHRTEGLIGTWLMNGTTQSQSSFFNPGQVGDLNWKIAGGGDFNADGKSDLVWQHQTNGSVGAWLMDGTSRVGVQMFGPGQVADTNWKIVGTGDFNADAKLDLVWQHQTNGQIGTWLMNGTERIEVRMFNPTTVSDTNWKIAGVGDFNGDTKPDLVWQHQVDGLIGVWLMNNTDLLQSLYFTPNQVSDTNWKIAGTGDFNADGKADLVWQHQTEGSIGVWLMNNTTQLDSTYFSPSQVNDTNWKIVLVR